MQISIFSENFEKEEKKCCLTPSKQSIVIFLYKMQILMSKTRKILIFMFVSQNKHRNLRLTRANL